MYSYPREYYDYPPGGQSRRPRRYEEELYEENFRHPQESYSQPPRRTSYDYPPRRQSRMPRGYVEGYYEEDPYRPNSRQPQEIYSHPSRRQTRQRHRPYDSYRNNEAWVTRVDKHDPRMQTGIRYFPETDTFVFPAKRGRGGAYVPAREYSGREFLRMYPNGNAKNIRRRRLDELRTTGRIRARVTDRFGDPWPADRQRPSRRGRDGGHGGGRESRPGNVQYEVEYPDGPEEDEEEIELGPLLLTKEPHWDGSSE